MTILWTNKSAAEATGGKAQGNWQAGGVSIDSRTVKPGDLFVAIRGENFDGHDYVDAALKNGAAAVVVSENVAADVPAVIVSDTMKALEALGIYARARSVASVVGVTGSVGKTSAKEMLRIALSAHGETYATKGNLNNHIGTPLNLANLPTHTPFAIFEMGMNHAGEISALTRMVQPHVAAITNVEAVHMEFFDSLEAIAEAKAEIFEGLVMGGTAVLNHDNALYPQLVTRAKAQGITRIITFGEHAKADCRLLDYGAGESGCAIEASIYGEHYDYTLGAVGRHWAITSLLVLAVMHALELDIETTIDALAEFSELPGRGAIMSVPVQGGEALLIDDSYNASPAAMRAAFSKTAEVWKGSGGQGRKLAALGNMLELGATGPSLHAGLAADLTKHGFDRVFTAGDLMKHLHDALPAKLRAGHVSKASELLSIIQKELRAGDVLLVKGSHGSKMYELAGALQSTGEKKHAV